MRIFILCLFSFALFASEELNDVVFAITPEKTLKMNIYLPTKQKANRPALMWIHGGGWKGGNRKNCHLKWLVEYGYVVASISYRFSHEAKYPAQLHDCKAGLRYLKAHASKYGIDPQRIAISGASAGGHLSALMATTAGDSFLNGNLGNYSDQNTKVPAVIDFYGATDFLLRSKNQPEKVNQRGGVVYELLGGDIVKKRDLAIKSSAALQVGEGASPLLIIHGSKDNVVLPDQSKRIHQVYQEKGLSSKLHIIQGAGHGGKAFQSLEIKQMILDFLNKDN